MITQTIEHNRIVYIATIIWSQPMDDLLTAETVLDYAHSTGSPLAAAHVENLGQGRYALEIVRNNDFSRDDDALAYCNDVTRDMLLMNAELEQCKEATSWAVNQLRLLENRIRRLEQR